MSEKNDGQVSEILEEELLVKGKAGRGTPGGTHHKGDGDEKKQPK
jgi:hypothetical protein